MSSSSEIIKAFLEEQILPNLKEIKVVTPSK